MKKDIASTLESSSFYGRYPVQARVKGKVDLTFGRLGFLDKITGRLFRQYSKLHNIPLQFSCVSSVSFLCVLTAWITCLGGTSTSRNALLQISFFIQCTSFVNLFALCFVCYMTSEKEITKVSDIQVRDVSDNNNTCLLLTRDRLRSLKDYLVWKYMYGHIEDFILLTLSISLGLALYVRVSTGPCKDEGYFSQHQCNPSHQSFAITKL